MGRPWRSVKVLAIQGIFLAQRLHYQTLMKGLHSIPQQRIPLCSILR